MIHETQTRQYRGHTVTVDWHYDSDSDPPWQNEDGHGPVRPERKGAKRPGERPLGNGWLYDWQEACKQARAEGWGGPIEQSVQADFDYLRRYISGDWFYVGRVVTVTDENGKLVSEDSVWGIDSDSILEYTNEAFTEAFDTLDHELSTAHDYACRC